MLRDMYLYQDVAWHPRRGQALVETAIVLVLFFTITLGLMTFGHAIMSWNMIRHAARDGAHVAATWPNRGTCGVLTNKSSIESMVQAEIAAVSGETFTVNVSQDPTPPGASPCSVKRCNGTGAICTQASDCSSGQQCVALTSVQVNVQGCVPYLFPIIPQSLGTTCPSGQVGFHVNQTLAFDDEG